MLKKLSEKDTKWREIALNITKGNKDLADEITQLMYIKLMDYNKELNDFYIAITLKHIYLNLVKKETLTSIDALYYLEDKRKEFEPNDKETEVISKANELPWYQQELIKESFDFSTRQIADKYNLNYGFVHREIHKGVKAVLGDNYDQYQNSNLKYKK